MKPDRSQSPYDLQNIETLLTIKVCFRIRPEKKMVGFPVTEAKNLGLVGRVFFFYSDESLIAIDGQ